VYWFAPLEKEMVMQLVRRARGPARATAGPASNSLGRAGGRTQICQFWASWSHHAHSAGSVSWGADASDATDCMAVTALPARQRQAVAMAQGLRDPGAITLARWLCVPAASR
jgi:hypothetical protein